MQHPMAFALIAVLAAGQAAANDRYDKLKFDKSTHTASTADLLVGGDSIYYTMKGTKGTRLSITFAPNTDSCGFNLYAPGMSVPIFQGGSGPGAYSGKLSEDGEYRVRVRMKGKPSKTCNFTLNVATKAK